MPPFIGIQGKQNKNQSSSKEEGYKSDGTYVRQRRRNKSPEKEYPANQLGLYDSQESLIPSYSGNRVARSSKRDSSPVSTTGSDYGNTGKKRRVTSEERQRQSSDEEEEIRSMARKKRSKRHISDDEEEEEELEPEKESIKKQEKEGLKEASKVNQEKNDGGKKKFVCFKDEKYIVKKAFFAPPEEAEDEEEIFCFPIGRPTLKYNVVLGYNTVYKPTDAVNPDTGKIEPGKRWRVIRFENGNNKNRVSLVEFPAWIIPYIIEALIATEEQYLAEEKRKEEKKKSKN